jgi:hypothetical protein
VLYGHLTESESVPSSFSAERVDAVHEWLFSEILQVAVAGNVGNVGVLDQAVLLYPEPQFSIPQED